MVLLDKFGAFSIHLLVSAAIVIEAGAGKEAGRCFGHPP
jgi:hypothetical protein